METKKEICKMCGGRSGFHSLTCGLHGVLDTLTAGKEEHTWEEIKQRGSAHYKDHANGGIEPIDLIRSLGLLRNFAIASIIKYASRSIGKPIVPDSDIDKIKHYADMLRFSCHYNH